MELRICDGSTLRLEDGTLGTFTDKNGNIVKALIVSNDCWKDTAKEPVVAFDRDKEAHTDTETTTTAVSAGCEPTQIRKSQAIRVCRNRSGEVIRCPPR